MEGSHIHDVGEMPGVAGDISDSVDNISGIAVKGALYSVEETRSCTRPDDSTLLDLIDRSTPHAAVDFLREARSLSQAALDTALILACQHGFKYLVHKLVQLGADIECRDAGGKTPVLICVENRYIDLVRFLVAKGADVKVVDCAGNNALILSISFAGSKEITQFILQQEDTMINHQNQNGYTAVMKALEVMDVGALHQLLEGYLSHRFSGQSSHTYQNDNHWTLLDQTVNCKGETAQQIAEKYALGNLFMLLKECLPKKSTPIQAAIGSHDLESAYYIWDSGIAENNDMAGALVQLFREHNENKGNKFTKEEMTMITRLVKCGADFKSCASDYHIPRFLFFAVNSGDYNLVEVLCKLGASPNHSIIGNENLPLSVAAKHGRVDLMKLLYKHKAEVNTDSFNNSPLDCALSHGQTECARFLVNHGAKVDITSAIASAMQNQVPEYMRFLFEHYASYINKYLIEVPKSGNTLLVEAVQDGNQEIIEQILQAGVDINEPQSSGATPIVESKNGAVAQFLISRGADVNLVTNNTHITPLMYALEKLSTDAYMYTDYDRIKEVISVLLEKGAFVNARTNNGRTPLMLAAVIAGQADILQMLLGHGAKCTNRDKDGNTALIHATVAGFSDNANCLIQFIKNNKGLNYLLNVQNNRGLTALMNGVVHCRWDIASKLIDNGADVNITDVNGNTALFHAISSVSPDSVLVNLIRAGCNVNHQNNAGLSPLMLAIMKYNYEGALALLNLGADVNAVNHNDTSKMALTYYNGNLDGKAISCLEALLDRGANASYLSPSALFTIISVDPFKLIPKLIKCGLVPCDYNYDEMPVRFRNKVPTLPSVSPLRIALLKGNAKLARYFWENLFVTNLDLSLASDNDVRHFLQEIEYEECLSFLDEIGSHSMSLERMCLVAASSAVGGSSPGREARVHQLELPNLLEELLLFKSAYVNPTQPQGRDDNPNMSLGVSGLSPFDNIMDSDLDAEDEYLGEEEEDEEEDYFEEEEEDSFEEEEEEDYFEEEEEEDYFEEEEEEEDYFGGE